jgi:hypothetical protein
MCGWKDLLALGVLFESQHEDILSTHGSRWPALRKRSATVAPLRHAVAFSSSDAM